MKPKNLYKIANKPWNTFLNPGTHFHTDTIQCNLLALFVLIRVIRRLLHHLG